MFLENNPYTRLVKRNSSHLVSMQISEIACRGLDAVSRLHESNSVEQILIQQGKLSVLARALEMAATRSKFKKLDFWSRRGVDFFNLGKEHEGKSAFLLGLQLNPGEKIIYAHLAEGYKKLFYKKGTGLNSKIAREALFWYDLALVVSEFPLILDHTGFARLKHLVGSPRSPESHAPEVV